MQDIEKLRAEIDQIHQEMAELFKQRLQLTEQIWKIKKEHQLPMLDQKREDNIVHGFDLKAADSAEKAALQNFFKSILIENKIYLETKLK